jgi:low temperature requirement protein LtrA
MAKTKEERHATWLELLCDLVFVVTISQLTHYLDQNLSLRGFSEFLFLFIPVWWTWLGTTFYAKRFYSENLKHRLLLLAQMGEAGDLAVNINGALGEPSSGFALSYAFLRFFLVIEYYLDLRRTSNKISATTYAKTRSNPLIKRYTIGFFSAATIWTISAFVPILELRFFMWIIALIIDFVTPITAGKLHSQHAPDVSHLPESMGLLTLIVLGESIVRHKKMQLKVR